MTSRRAAFQAAEAHQVLDVLRGKQILAGRQRRIVIGGDLGQKRVIERIARLLEPAQAERPQAARISERVVADKFRIGVDRKLAALRQDRFDRLDAGEIVGQRHAADLHLHHRIAGVEMASHLVLQIVAWSCPARTSRRRHSRTLSRRSCRRCSARRAPRCSGFSGDLGHRVPHRDLDGADADRALAMAAGFLVLHHHGEDLFRREIIAGVVEQRLRIGLQDARNEPRAHLRAAGVAPGGIEGEAA